MFLLTCSGCDHRIDVGKTDTFTENDRYRVQILCPADGNVILLYRVVFTDYGKKNTHEQPLDSFINQLWILPLCSNDAISAEAQLFLPHLETPRLSFDWNSQVDQHAAQALDNWCSELTNFSSVDQFERAFDGSKVEAGSFLDFWAQFST